VLVVRQGECKLYELFGARRAGNGWTPPAARSSTSAPTPAAGRLTSADAAGLPILPASRATTVAAGAINHALRFTSKSRRWLRRAGAPAASDDSDRRCADGPAPAAEAGYSLSRFHGESLVILNALKRYG